MARDGIDAFLVVISVCCLFVEDEKAAISRLLTLFGTKFYDYMIIVFTGGDELEDDDESLIRRVFTRLSQSITGHIAQQILLHKFLCLSLLNQQLFIISENP